MSKFLFITFSGTGNTGFAAAEIIKALEDIGASATCLEMEKLLQSPEPRLPEDDQYVGILFPVHAFNAPPLVEEFIRRLPASTKHRNYFLIKTAGSPWANGGSTSRVQNLLARKKWHLQYEAVIPMPSNFAVSYPDEIIKLNLHYAKLQAELIAKDLHGGKRRILPKPLQLSLLSELGRIEHIGARMYGHYLKVEDNCIHCGKCLRDCPTRNISFSDGRFSFGWHCTFCMRCSFFCPVQAFNNRHLGRAVMLKRPFDLKKIAADDSIAMADIQDDNQSQIKNLREFYQREGVI